jgi:hypothetical protein
MKKLLLLLCLGLFFILSSCSEEAPQPKELYVTAIINGVPTFFNTINVHPETYTEDGDTYTDLEITASIDNDPDLRISFVIEKYIKGTTAGWYFAYFLHETAYPKMPEFTMDVLDNTEHHLLGTFSGQVKADVAPFEVVNIQEGTFDIIY